MEPLCRNCKKPGHIASECCNEPVCNTCGKPGHLAKGCAVAANVYVSPKLLQVVGIWHAKSLHKNFNLKSARQSTCTISISTCSVTWLASEKTHTSIDMVEIWNDADLLSMWHWSDNSKMEFANATWHFRFEVERQMWNFGQTYTLVAAPQEGGVGGRTGGLLPKAWLCNNCYRPGHLAVECWNEKACNNCREPGHLARDCLNSPVCNGCSQRGHIARDCPRLLTLHKMAPPPPSPRRPGAVTAAVASFGDMVCHNCHQPGHMSKECLQVGVCVWYGNVYILIPTFVMSHTPWCPGTLGNGCSQFGSHSLLSHFSPAHKMAPPPPGPRRPGAPSFGDTVCLNCHQPSHMSKECLHVCVCDMEVYTP